MFQLQTGLPQDNIWHEMLFLKHDHGCINGKPLDVHVWHTRLQLVNRTNDIIDTIIYGPLTAVLHTYALSTVTQL